MTPCPPCTDPEQARHSQTRRALVLVMVTLGRAGGGGGRSHTWLQLREPRGKVQRYSRGAKQRAGSSRIARGRIALASPWSVVTVAQDKNT